MDAEYFPDFIISNVAVLFSCFTGLLSLEITFILFFLIHMNFYLQEVTRYLFRDINKRYDSSGLLFFYLEIITDWLIYLLYLFYSYAVSIQELEARRDIVPFLLVLYNHFTYSFILSIYLFIIAIT